MEEENFENYKFSIFYFNKNDYRVIIPKINKNLVWTLNFARWQTYLFLFLLISLIIGEICYN